METRLEIILEVQGQKFYLDTTGVDAIPLTYNIANIADISTTQGSYSKTITIPETINNRKIFNNITDLNSSSTFNPNIRSRAYILVDSILIIDGYFQLTDFSIDKNNHFNTISLLIFTDNNDFYTLLGENLLEDLNLSRFDHKYNYDNVVSSWYDPSTNKERNYTWGYYYPLIDYGYDWNINNINGTTPPGSLTASMVEVSQLKPALYARAIWDEIFNEAGFKWTSSSLSSTGFDTLIVPFNNNIIQKSEDDTKKSYFRIGMNSDLSLNLLNDYWMNDTRTAGSDGRWEYNNVYLDTTDQPVLKYSDRIPFNNKITGGNTDPNNLWDSTGYNYQNNTSEPQTMAFNLSLIVKQLYWYSGDHLPKIQIYRSIDPQDGTINDGYGFPFKTDISSSTNYSNVSTDDGWSRLTSASAYGVKQDVSFIQITGHQIGSGIVKYYTIATQTYNAFEYMYKNMTTDEITLKPGEQVFVRFEYCLAGSGDFELVQQAGKPFDGGNPDGHSIQGYIGYDKATKDPKKNMPINYILNKGRNLANIVTSYNIGGITYNSFIYSIPSNITGLNQTIKANSIVPKQIKQKDFILSIIKMFNLYVEPDKNNPKTLLIETRDAFYTNNEVIKDWSKKIDLVNPIDVQVLGDTQNKRILLKYKDDKDWYNTTYKNAFNITFGEKIYTQESEFATGDKTLEIIFSPTPIMNLAKTSTDGLAGSTASSIILPKIEFINNGVVSQGASNIRILQKKWVYLQTKDYWIINKGQGKNIQPIQQTGYPYCGYLDDPFNPNYDFNFDVVNTFYPQTNTTQNTLYKLYWEKQILETTDKDSRIITANFYLTPEDVYNFKFSDNIFLDFGDGGQYYKVNKIEYDPTIITTSKVELIKTKSIIVPKTTVIATKPNSVPWHWKDWIYNGHNHEGNNIYDSGVEVKGDWNSIYDRNTWVNGDWNNISSGNTTVHGSWNNVSSWKTAVKGDYNFSTKAVDDSWINGNNNYLYAGSQLKVIGDNNTIKPAIGSTERLSNVIAIGNNQTITKSNTVNIGATLIVSPSVIKAGKDEVLSPFSDNVFPNYISASKDRVREWGSFTNIMVFKAGKNAVLSDQVGAVSTNRFY